MPIGPNGERRPQGATACAVHVLKVAAGEIEEERAPRLSLQAYHAQARSAPRAREGGPVDVPRASSHPPFFTNFDE